MYSNSCLERTEVKIILKTVHRPRISNDVPFQELNINTPLVSSTECNGKLIQYGIITVAAL